MNADASPAVALPVQPADITAAARRIAGPVLRTPLIRLPLPGEIYAKAENLQRTGSFKLRGAFNAVSRLGEEQRARGVVTHSSGNHGQGLARAAAMLNVPATIVIPEGAPQVKVERTLAQGARVVRCGASAREREEAAQAEAEAHGLTLIPPFDHPDVIAGQGTLALEIMEQLPGVRNVLVPVGGGGLISGVALALGTLADQVKVIGVEPELAADAAQSFQERRPVSWPAELTNRTRADGVRTQQVGALNLPIILEHVHGFQTVSEEAIEAAARFYLTEARLVAEPTGALTLAALLSLAEDHPLRSSGPTVVVLTGGNADGSYLAGLLDS